MVSRKTNRRKAVESILIVALTMVSFTFAYFASRIVVSNTEEQEPNEIIIDVPPEKPEEPEEPVLSISQIDFQPTIDSWVNSTGGEKGIIIYDLDLDKIVGQYNADVKFDTASLYKLFVVYEGYRRVQNDAINPDEIAGWTGRTILQCLDLAIRESHSPCAETLWSIIGHDELNEIVQNDFEIPSVIVSNLEATPTEIMQVMKLFYTHPDFTDEVLVAQMKDSFLNQPITTYNWRQGLPSGFSDKVAVYNKVGWNWNGEYWTIYDDAAILDFINEDRHFIAVVMTSGVRYQQIRDLGTQIEEAFYSQNVLKN